MPAVQTIEEWGAPYIQTFPLTVLRHAVIGVDASHYLDLRLNSPASFEPLLNAIGGNPYTLKAALQDDLEAFKAVDATMIFIFDGLDYNSKELYISQKSIAASKAHKEGWKEYYNKENGKGLAAERTLKAFSKASGLNQPRTITLLTVISGYPVGKVTRYFQSLLHQHSVPFLVAPYSAAAQVGDGSW